MDNESVVYIHYGMNMKFEIYVQIYGCGNKHSDWGNTAQNVKGTFNLVQLSGTYFIIFQKSQSHWYYDFFCHACLYLQLLTNWSEFCMSYDFKLLFSITDSPTYQY